MRIGIIGTGRIAHRFVPEARTIAQIEITAVCNPRAESASEFATEFGIPYWTTQTDELMGYVDAVYIATPHQTHYQYAKEFLLNSVHVLCEKPMVFSKQQAEELFEIANKKHCVLMEAIKTAYCPGFVKLLEVLKEDKIGTVRDVEACFSRLTPTNTREMTDIQNGGSFLELGSYTLFPIMKILGMQEKEIQFHSIKGANGIDIYTKAYTNYENAIGTAKTGLGVKSEGELVIAGTKGYIVVQAPWWMTRHFEIRRENPERKEIYDFSYEGAGLRYEIAAFAELVQGNSVADSYAGVNQNESIWLAHQMERFLNQKDMGCVKTTKENQPLVRVWAHRGCSMVYPENTLEAFQTAAEIPGIAGIELDVQLTRDGELVVIHDEKVDRTTNGTGRVCDFNLDDIKMLKIESVNSTQTTIPTLEEVFVCLMDICKDDNRKEKFLINIELKNSIIRYEGMEEKVLALIEQYNLLDNIVFSSFLPESMGLIKKLQPHAHTGILGMSMRECLKEAKQVNADAIHPWIGGLDLEIESIEKLRGISVRAWNGEEPFFGQDRILREHHMEKHAQFGVTDIFTNVPEMYLTV